jgi:hypothetical protein
MAKYLMTKASEAKRHDRRLIIARATAWAVAEFTKDKANKSLRAKFIHDLANAVVKTGDSMR